MWTYIVRRFLLMGVTLFGITLVTYSIMRLTPGDPTMELVEKAKAQGKISRSTLEYHREHYNLDKPSIFNTHPSSRWTRWTRILDDYDSVDESAVADLPANLRELGAAGLAPAFATLAQAVDDEAAGRPRPRPEGSGSGEGAKPLPPLSGHVVRALPHLAFGLRDLPPAGADRAAWEAWWATRKDELEPAQVAVEVERYLAGRVAIDELVARCGTLATPGLYRALAAADDPGDLDRLTRALARINAKPTWILSPDVAPASPEGRVALASHVRSWGRWYGRNGSKFYDLSYLQYLTRTVTETQYGTWVGRLLQLDFGDSTKYSRPVIGLIRERLSVTVQLALMSVFLAYLIAIPLGIFSVVSPGSRTDTVVTIGLFVLYSLPSFWVGNLMILFLTGNDTPFNLPFQSNHLGTSGLSWGDWGAELVLPLACYTYGSFAYISRQMRAGMMEVIRADYIRTARAKGLSERTVIFKHALRNSLIPVLTIMANVLPALIGGSVIIEQIFGIDGMGKLAYESIENRDYPVEMAVAFFSAILTLVGILISDLSYALVDPRITYN